MTEDELAAKFLSLAKDVIGERKARKVIDAVLDMENLDSVGQLISQIENVLNRNIE